MDIIVDTNFIVECVRKKTDIARELDRIIEGRWEIVVPSGVHDELGNVADGKVSILVLRALKSRFLSEPPSGKGVDSDILQYAAHSGGIVGTQDRALKEKLKKQGMAVVTVRQKGVLALIAP